MKNKLSNKKVKIMLIIASGIFLSIAIYFILVVLLVGGID